MTVYSSYFYFIKIMTLGPKNRKIWIFFKKRRIFRPSGGGPEINFLQIEIFGVKFSVLSIFQFLKNSNIEFFVVETGTFDNFALLSKT